MNIRLAIVGTQALLCSGDKLSAEAYVYDILRELSPDVVISGGAAGVDSIAEMAARSIGYIEEDGTLVIHRPKVRSWAMPGGFRDRNRLIANECTHLLRLACVQSSTFGSGWTAAHAISLGKTVRDYTVCPEEDDNVE